MEEGRAGGGVGVVRGPSPDPPGGGGRWGVVDVTALCPVAPPVSLAEIKAEPRLARVALGRQSRLAVVPVGAEEWRILCAMLGTPA